MAKKEADNGSDAGYPPYIPWKSFNGYVAGLKKVGTPPHTLDSSTRPTSMAGGMWRSLLSALRFLKLIEQDGKATEKLYKLVKAHGGSEWQAAVKQCVTAAYSPVIGDLPLDNASVAQLDSRFRAHSKIEGQLLRRAERFYLHALRDAGVKFSPLFSMRRESSGSVGKRRNQVKKGTSQASTKVTRTATNDGDTGNGGSGSSASELPKGMIDMPIPISGTASSYIRVPLKISKKQMPLVKAAFDMIAAMAEQNGD